jgi:hypothetical protein
MDVLELLTELTELEESDLKAKKRDELRKVLGTLVQGESARINKLKKAELIQEIQERVADYRETVRKAEAFDRVVPDVTDDEIENIDAYVTQVDELERNDIGHIAAETYAQFRAFGQKRFVDGTWLEYPAEMSDLANQLAARLESKSDVSTTILKYRSDALNHMQKLLELEQDQFYFGQLWRYLTGHSYEDIKRGRKSRGKGEDCQPCFAKSLYQIWKYTHAVEKKSKDKAQTDAKELGYKGIEVTRLLQWADDVLTRLRPDETNRKLWRPVSVALALATGRRQVEIHSTGSFEFVDDYHVKFSGQAKTRGKAFEAYEENPSYIIPTLLKAELVVKGHEWLKTHSGMFYDLEEKGERATVMVNKNVNQNVGKFWKLIAREYLTMQDKDGNDILNPEKLIYHNLREIYALVSYEAEGKYEFKPTVQYRWVNKVLGEDKGNTGATSTAARYLDEFSLIDGSLARI